MVLNNLWNGVHFHTLIFCSLKYSQHQYGTASQADLHTQTFKMNLERTRSPSWACDSKFSNKEVSLVLHLTKHQFPSYIILEFFKPSMTTWLAVWFQHHYEILEVQEKAWVTNSLLNLEQIVSLMLTAMDFLFFVLDKYMKLYWLLKA